MKKACIGILLYPLIILGTVLFLFGVKDFIDTQDFLSAAQTVSGKVIDNTLTDSGHYSTTNGHTTYVSPSYKPKVQFTTLDGQVITFEPSTSYGGSLTYNTGETVNVRYDATNPNNASIADFINTWLGTILLLSFGLLFLGIGLVPLLLMRAASKMIKKQPGGGYEVELPQSISSKLQAMVQQPNTGQSFIPNPFQQSNLTDLNQKTTVIADGASGVIDLVKLPILIIVLAVVIGYLHLSWFVVVFVTLFQAIAAYFKIRAVKEIRSIPNDGSGDAFLQVLRKQQYYKIANLVANVPTSGVIAYIVVSGVATVPSAQFLLGGYYNWLVIIIAVITPILQGVEEYVRYRLYSNIDGQNKDVAQINQSLEVIDEEVKLVDFLTKLPIFLGAFFLIGKFALTHQAAPGGVGDNATLITTLVIFGFAFLLLPILSFIMIKRIKGVNLQNPLYAAAPPVAPSDVSQATTVTPLPTGEIPITSPIATTPPVAVDNKGETVLTALYGIMNRQQHGYAVLGVGKMVNTENTLFITDKRLLFIEVPAAGGDKIVGDTDYAAMNFFWNRAEIQKNGQYLLQTQPLEQILASNQTNYAIAYDQIQSFELKNMQITIQLSNGTAKGFLFMDKGHIDLIKNILLPILGPRIIFG